MRMLLSSVFAAALSGSPLALASEDAALLHTLDDPRSALVPLEGASPSARVQSYAEDFESFRLGRLSFQGGWTAAGNANIFNASSEPAFGAFAVTRRSGVSDNFGTIALSPPFPNAVGSMSVDVQIFNDDGTEHFLSTLSRISRLVNVRIRFVPGGAIQALGPDPANPGSNEGLFFDTRGAWTPGVVTRITIEVTKSGGVLVAQDGVVIYGGADISALRSPNADRGFSQVIFSQRETGLGTGIMRFDNIVVEGVPEPNADLDGDGIVGPDDLGILLGLWGPALP